MDGDVHLSICHSASLTPTADRTHKRVCKESANELDVIFLHGAPGEMQPGGVVSVAFIPLVRQIGGRVMFALLASWLLYVNTDDDAEDCVLGGERDTEGSLKHLPACTTQSASPIQTSRQLGVCIHPDMDVSGCVASWEREVKLPTMTRRTN